MSKNLSNKHLSRKELIVFSKSVAGALPEHLSVCKDCSGLLELFTRFQVAGERQLENVPAGWIEKAVAIAKPKRVKEAIQQLVAYLAFDSWTQPIPIGVRSMGQLANRRVRYNVNEYSIDIRMEKQQTEYAFIATVSKKDERDPSFTLVSAGRSVVADEDGYYQWVSSRPPKRISFHSSDIIIHLPVTLWNKPS